MREFKRRRINSSDLEILLRSARIDLGTLIKGSKLPPRKQLVIAYASTPDGPRRIVYLLAVEDGDLFLLFYRSKDDPVGKNITVKNPDFKKEPHDRLGLLRSDIEADRFDTYELPSM
ncbi:MAG: hypothetical protein AAGJ81_01230 [Verrucomicrobiota bacterium]